MKRAVQPASPLGWWSFWLSFATVVWGGLFLLLPGLLGPRLAGGALRIPVGFAGVVLELVLALAAFSVGAAALRKGERSWMLLAALAAAVLVSGFWIVFALGEVVSPH
jgi:hypothetical protein